MYSQTIKAASIFFGVLLLGAGCSAAPAAVPAAGALGSSSAATTVAPTSTATPTTAPSAAAKPKPAAAPAPIARTNTVVISNNTFQPATIKVKIGTTVIWKNNDSAVHTVNAERGQFRSGSVLTGAMFSHKFAEAGIFSYSCSIHPTMRGTVVVEQ